MYGNSCTCERLNKINPRSSKTKHPLQNLLHYRTPLLLLDKGREEHTAMPVTADGGTDRHPKLTPQGTVLEAVQNKEKQREARDTLIIHSFSSSFETSMEK